MKNLNESTQLILQSASAEFMKNGFEKASMRTIAKNAGVTTGSLYARYPNKDAIFGALVEPVITSFVQANDKGNNASYEILCSGKAKEIWSASQGSKEEIIELIYNNKTEFSLLINSSNGSSYENFIDRIIEIEEKETYEFLAYLKQNNYVCMEVSKQVIHMLISAHCYALFEIVRHDCTKEDAQKQVNQINEFFACGWNKIFGL